MRVIGVAIDGNGLTVVSGYYSANVFLYLIPVSFLDERVTVFNGENQLKIDLMVGIGHNKQSL